MIRFSEENHAVLALAPSADALAGTVYSDVISMKHAARIAFVLIKGDGATGTTAVTLEECDDTTPSNSSAIAFEYKVCTSGDTWGTKQTATTAGFTTTAGADQMYCIEVDAAGLSAGYPYLRLKMVEDADDPCVAGVLAVLSDLRDASESNTTAIT